MTRLLAALVVTLGLSAAGSATAASFNGSFWDAPADSFANITDAIAFTSGKTPDATFTSTAIAYGEPGFGIGSLSDFLNGDASSIVGDGSVNFQESVLRLTGFSFLTMGDEITVTSDDGFLLSIGGTEFSRFDGLRGPGGSTTETFMGATGRYAVDLWYFEGNPVKAQLESNLAPAPVPLPAGGLLLLTALAGGALARRRRVA